MYQLPDISCREDVKLIFLFRIQKDNYNVLLENFRLFHYQNEVFFTTGTIEIYPVAIAQRERLGSG